MNRITGRSAFLALLKDEGVTSVVCMCDPAMLAFGLTPKANEQDYEPEWVTAGLVFVDQDVVAQTIDGRQWAHAFGTAYNAESERIRGSFPYYAYKSVRPDDEPAAGVEELYYQMYLLSIGIQMAGPNLTPESFQAGMFAYPGAFGPRGSWHFAPGDHTSVDDFREIWWDPERISAQNSRSGAWVELNGGARWSNANPPSGPLGYCPIRKYSQYCCMSSSMAAPHMVRTGKRCWNQLARPVMASDTAR